MQLGGRGRKETIGYQQESRWKGMATGGDYLWLWVDQGKATQDHPVNQEQLTGTKWIPSNAEKCPRFLEHNGVRDFQHCLTCPAVPENLFL